VGKSITVALDIRPTRRDTGKANVIWPPSTVSAAEIARHRKDFRRIAEDWAGYRN
jgi:hypothetical protein